MGRRAIPPQQGANMNLKQRNKNRDTNGRLHLAIQRKKEREARKQRNLP